MPSQRMVSKLQLSMADMVIKPLHGAKGKHPELQLNRAEKSREKGENTTERKGEKSSEFQ